MMAAAQTYQPRGELRRQESLARYTTWRVGGPAKQMYRPADMDDLAAFIAELPQDEPLMWLGLGSNLLVRDGGFNGTVIATQGGLDNLSIEADVISAEAGVACAKVAREAARAGLTGAAFLAGIPGTMGGALAMNAGAFGGETWPIVGSVTTMDRRGDIHHRSVGDFEYGYRHVEGPAGEFFVACELRLQAGDTEAEQQSIKALLAKRGATQPTGKPSGGSTFRNPEGDYAARLIEVSGLKGHRIGGAQVSQKHANFIINEADATAQDIEDLINDVQQQVEQQQGVCLQREVHIVGEPA